MIKNSKIFLRIDLQNKLHDTLYGHDFTWTFYFKYKQIWASQIKNLFSCTRKQIIVGDL